MKKHGKKIRLAVIIYLEDVEILVMDSNCLFMKGVTRSNVYITVVKAVFVRLAPISKRKNGRQIVDDVVKVAHSHAVLSVQPVCS